MPTPTVSDTYTAGLGSTQQTLGSLHSVSLAQVVNRDDLLPTPRAANGDQRNQTIFHRPAGKPQNIENALYELLPTPKALDGVKGNLKTSQERIDAGNQVDLTNVAVDLALLGTPRTSSGKGTTSKEVENGALRARLKDQVEILNLLPTPLVDDAKNTGHNKNRIATLASETYDLKPNTWGRFAKAIDRWQQVIGREAPPATKPDGKDGAHRLSPDFTEWLMGLPRGWVTEVGLTRNEALKACGNGVVPQQAALALRVLLENTQIKGINK